MSEAGIFLTGRTMIARRKNYKDGDMIATPAAPRTRARRRRASMAAVTAPILARDAFPATADRFPANAGAQRHRID